MATAPQPGTDRDQLAATLRQSRDKYLNCVKAVPESAASIRLTENSWSILEIAEHVAAAEHGMFRGVELATPKTSPTNYALDTEILKRGRNREAKGEAPERSRPKGRWKTMAEAIAAFENSRANTLAFAETGTKDPRRVEWQHPLFGALDGHQVLLLMAAHAERHTAQIEEIKVTDAYKRAVGH